MRDAMIYGESAHAILTAMSKNDHRITGSGMHEFDLRMTPDEAGPVVRALMRVEAELLIKDADAFDPALEGAPRSNAAPTLCSRSSRPRPQHSGSDNWRSAESFHFAHQRWLCEPKVFDVSVHKTW